MSQLTLNFEPSLPERFGSLRAFIHYRAMATRKQLKSQAADMDLAVSTLSRKLNPAEGDTQRFNVDDLEAWLESTDEASAVIEYLAARFLQGDEQRRARALMRFESLTKDLEHALALLKETS